LTDDEYWKTLIQAAFEHAFRWLGFGAKTAVGYGAMTEDLEKKQKREDKKAQEQENARRAALSPEDRAFEENAQTIDAFRKVFEAARQAAAYQPGQDFDSKRHVFIDKAKSWDEPRSRREA